MPRLRSLFAKSVGLPLKSFLKREPTRRISKELDRAQWLSREGIHDLQSRRLRETLVAVGRDVPCYRDEFRRLGAQAERDDPWLILRSLPLLDKAAYRKLGRELVSETARHKPMIAHTSGTTGERLEVRIDPIAATYRYLAGFRGRHWWGIEPGDPEFKIWGSGIRTASSRRELAWKLLRRGKDWTVGITMVSPFFQTEEDLLAAARLLMRTRPAFVFGYANSVHLIASCMVKHGLQSGPGWPRAVGYTAEMLHDWQRDEIATAFRAPVVAEYGSCEAGVIAWQCPEGSLHTSDDISVVEIIDGEVVVTSLVAMEYPLIRYRQGDLALRGAGSCACGRGLGTITGLKGRMNDLFSSRSGGIIDFIVFDQAMKDQPAIRRFKVVERARGDIVFLAELHPGRTWEKDDRERLLSQCRALLPPDVALSVRTADRLPTEASGKFRIMIPEKEAANYL